MRPFVNHCIFYRKCVRLFIIFAEQRLIKGITYSIIKKVKFRGRNGFMLLSFFQLSLAIRNVWPKRMSLKAFLMLYLLLLVSGMPVTLLSCVPYGLFGILAAVCMFGLAVNRDTISQNVCMGMIGCVLAVLADNFFVNSIASADSAGCNQPKVCFVWRQAGSYFFVLFRYAVLRKAA